MVPGAPVIGAEPTWMPEALSTIAIEYAFVQVVVPELVTLAVTVMELPAGALAGQLMVPFHVIPLEGLDIVTVIVSLVVPPAFVALIVTGFVTAPVGVPDIRPVDVLIESPAGRFVAL